MNWWTGKKHTKEAKEKMREAKLKNPTRYWLGKKRSEETIKKMSVSSRGRKPNSGSFKKGQIPWCKGKKFSDEHKRKISEGRLERKKRLGYLVSPEAREKISETLRGENAPNWQGGKSFEPYSIKFNGALKRKIRKRDNYTCQECGWTQEQIGQKLDIHHIDYDKKNNKPENLISLCRSCHTQTNFSREDWTEYFLNKGRTSVRKNRKL